MMVMKPFFVLPRRPPYSFNHNDYDHLDGQIKKHG